MIIWTRQPMFCYLTKSEPVTNKLGLNHRISEQRAPSAGDFTSKMSLVQLMLNI